MTSSTRSPNSVLAKLALAAAVAALALGSTVPAHAVTSTKVNAIAGEVSLGHACRWSNADFTVAALSTIPAGGTLTVTTTGPYYNLFAATSNNQSMVMTKLNDSTWQARALVAIPAGTVVTIATSGFAMPASGTTVNTISGLGARYTIGYVNGKGPC